MLAGGDVVTVDGCDPVVGGVLAGAAAREFAADATMNNAAIATKLPVRCFIVLLRISCDVS